MEGALQGTESTSPQIGGVREVAFQVKEHLTTDRLCYGKYSPGCRAPYHVKKRGREGALQDGEHLTTDRGS